MIASTITGMLCVHLVCFCVMFLLIRRRLGGRTMGLGVSALGNLLLGGAYVLQLSSSSSVLSPLTMLNRTMTLCAPVAYLLGANALPEMWYGTNDRGRYCGPWG
jgi:hypothetical protein